MKRIIMLLIVVMFVAFAGVNSIAAETPKDELRIARVDDITQLDPGWMTATNREFAIMDCIFNGLAKYKPGTWEVVPDLAESWDISEDGEEITFYLRKGVQFQKGYGEMTANDVKFSFERIIDPEVKSPEKETWDALDHVEMIDQYTVKLVLKYPSARLFISTLPSNAGMIVSKKAVEEMGREKFAHDPIGTGPYEFVSWEPRSSLELKVFENYWGEQPAMKKLTFIPITDTLTVEMALETGEVDTGRISLQSIKRFQENPNFKVYLKPDLAYWWIGFMLNKPPFDNLKAREAIRYAVDVDKIIQAAYYGVSEKSSQMFPPGMLGYWEDAPIHKVDLDKARELLKEAGYPNGFKITFMTYPREVVKVTAEIVKADLEKIGIDVDIDIKEAGAFVSAIQELKGEGNLYMDRYSSGVDPGYTSQWFITDQIWNYSKWSNPEYDRLWKEAESEMDFQKRAEIYVNMQKIVEEDCWAIWLTPGTRVLVTQKDINIGQLFPDSRLACWLISRD